MGEDFLAKISETVRVHIAHMAFFSNWGRPPNLGVVTGEGPNFQRFWDRPGGPRPLGAKSRNLDPRRLARTIEDGLP